MTQKERLEEIRKKHEKERLRKKIINHRIIVGAAAFVVIVILILIIKGCVSGMEKRAAQNQSETQTVTGETDEPSASIYIDPNVISKEYYANSAVIGNSFADDLMTYGLLDGADIYARTGLSVNDAMTETTQNGEVPVIDELDTDKKYKRIFMIFGENELGWRDSSTFAEQYGMLIDKACEYQPQSEIYLLAITPITKKASEENIDNTNNEEIKEYNDIIKSVAEEKGVKYVDLYSAVADADGNLPSDAASDGIHFGKDYYEKCLLYIQNNDTV